MKGFHDKVSHSKNLEAMKAVYGLVPKPKVRKVRAKELVPRQQPEAELRRLVVPILRKRGFKTYRIETAVRGQLGLPDFWIAHRTGRLGTFLELKAPHGIQSDEQFEFEDLCRLNRIPYKIIKSVEEAQCL